MTCPNPSPWDCPSSTEAIWYVLFKLIGVVDCQEIDMLAGTSIFCPNYAGDGISPYNSWSYPLNATGCGSLCTSGAAGCVGSYTVKGVYKFTVGGTSSASTGTQIFELGISPTILEILGTPNSLFGITLSSPSLSPTIIISYSGIQTITFVVDSSLPTIYMESSDPKAFVSTPYTAPTATNRGYYTIDASSGFVTITIGLSLAISTATNTFYSDSALTTPIFRMTLGADTATPANSTMSLACTSGSSYKATLAAPMSRNPTVNIVQDLTNLCPTTLPGSNDQILTAAYLMRLLIVKQDLNFVFAQTAADIYTQLAIITSGTDKSIAQCLAIIPNVMTESFWSKRLNNTDHFDSCFNQMSSPGILKCPGCQTDASNTVIQADLSTLYCHLYSHYHPKPNPPSGFPPASTLQDISNAIIQLNKDGASLTDGWLTAIIGIINQEVASGETGTLVNTTDLDTLDAVLQLADNGGNALWNSLLDVIHQALSNGYVKDICAIANYCNANPSYQWCDSGTPI